MSTKELQKELQKEHYNRIYEDYMNHYFDECSMKYREKFIHPYLYDINLSRNDFFLDAMCGPGTSTEVLLSLGVSPASIMAQDFSDKFVSVYRLRHPQVDVRCESICETSYADNTFDKIFITGGLHHLPPNLEKGLQEMVRILKPGGSIYAMEPLAESVWDLARRMWYRRDHYFEDNEQAVSLAEIISLSRGKLKIKKIRYLGGPGYIVILNSLILRIPKSVKKLLTPALMLLEVAYNALLPRWLKLYSIFELQNVKDSVAPND